MGLTSIEITGKDLYKILRDYCNTDECNIRLHVPDGYNIVAEIFLDQEDKKVIKDKLKKGE